MFSHIGLESLVQRGRSAFYTDLVSLYQNAHEALYEAKNAKDKEIVTLLAKIKFTDNLKATILKHTQLPIRKAHLVPEATVNLMCGMELNNEYKHQKRYNSVSLGSVMEEINRLYNDRTGRMREQMDVKDIPFIFDIYLYSGDFKMRNDDGSFYITAEELAAATLHEVGHVDFFIRMFWRAQMRLVDASDVVTYLKQAPDKKVILDLLDAMMKNKRFTKKWGKSLGLLREEFVKSNDDSDPIKLEFISALCTIIGEDISSEWLGIVGQLSGYSQYRTQSNLFEIDNERTADEYATRHGATVALTSFLVKIDRFAGPDFARYRKAMKGSEAFFITKLLVRFFGVFNVFPEEISDGYDPLIRRLELIVETAKHAFHDDDLPPKVAEQLKADIREAEIYLHQYRTADYRASRLKMKQWFDNIGKFKRFISSPFHERITEYHSKVQDATRSLSRNPLYYLAKK